jgi:pyridoxine 5-phosphate synthase
MTKLSVNLNKVALLRNQRDIGYPSVLESAESVLRAGAHGITIHPRPDERHIRRSDVKHLADFMAAWPEAEFNIEGYPTDDFIDLVCTHTCHQVTLVPDAPDQNTSDHGWDIADKHVFLTDVVTKLKNAGRRVSLFIDPDPAIPALAAQVGADRVELYTGPYALDLGKLDSYVRTAHVATAEHLGVNAGHDLNLDNLSRFISAIPECDEVSIGHALIADALKFGWNGAVAAYLTAIDYGTKHASKHDDRARA